MNPARILSASFVFGSCHRFIITQFDRTINWIFCTEKMRMKRENPMSTTKFVLLLQSFCSLPLGKGKRLAAAVSLSANRSDGRLPSHPHLPPFLHKRPASNRHPLRLRLCFPTALRAGLTVLCKQPKQPSPFLFTLSLGTGLCFFSARFFLSGHIIPHRVPNVCQRARTVFQNVKPLLVRRVRPFRLFRLFCAGPAGLCHFLLA